MQVINQIPLSQPSKYPYTFPGDVSNSYVRLICGTRRITKTGIHGKNESATCNNHHGESAAPDIAFEIYFQQIKIYQLF
jgi:hypothetical protein